MLAIQACAKLNLILNVVQRNMDGYHYLETIMVPISLHDNIFVKINNSKKIEIKSNIEQLPTDQRNSVYLACLLMQEKYQVGYGFDIFIEKNIPLMSGLGGGSSDAAAVLHAVNHLCSLGKTANELAIIGEPLSWDVPFFIHSKAAVILGSANNINFINNTLVHHVLLIQPHYGISTGNAFTQLNLTMCPHPSYIPLIDKLSNNDFIDIGEVFGNSFLSLPLISEDYKYISDILYRLGFDAVSLSGTGSCFFAIVKDIGILMEGYNYLKKIYPYVKVCEFTYA